VAWLDPVEELDELGLLEGDWSWPLVDDWSLPLLDELEPDPDFEPPLDPEDDGFVWPA
jgi:hypothetical protein